MNRGVRITLTLASCVTFASLVSGCTATGSADADNGSISVPAPTGVVFEGSVSGWADAMVDCLVTAGWDASIPPGTPPGGFDSGVVDETQDDAYHEDLAACTTSVGEYVEIKSEADLRDRFDRLVRQQRCLIEAGYEVSDPPSYQTYLDAFNARGDASVFYPLSELGADMAVQAAEACPFELE